jgi:hypothetical protein
LSFVLAGSLAHVLQQIEHYISFVFKFVQRVLHPPETTFCGREARFQLSEPELQPVEAFPHAAHVGLNGVDQLAEQVEIDVFHGLLSIIRNLKRNEDRC